jgi:hypothetical protein
VSGSSSSQTNIAAANLIYTDGSVAAGSPAGVTGTVDGNATEANGVDGQIITKGWAGSAQTDFLVTDLFVDTLKPSGSGLFDIYGNPAKTVRVVPITGITHPYLLVASWLTPTSISVTYSKTMNTTAAPSALSALDIANYTLTSTGTPTSGIGSCPASVSLTGQTVSSSDTQTFVVSSPTEVLGCNYTITVAATIIDQQQNAIMTDPRALPVAPNLQVARAEAASAFSVYVYFTKPVNIADITASHFQVSSELGAVVSAVRDPSNPAKVLVTHSISQQFGFYTVIGINPIHVQGSSELLAPPPGDRATFESVFGAPQSIADGPMFRDPFADGSTFAFTFNYRGLVYVGPNDSTQAVFRFLPDGSNPVEARFNTHSALNTTRTYRSFGINGTRYSVKVERTASYTAYQFPAGTNLVPLANSGTACVDNSDCASNSCVSNVCSVANDLKFSVTGCTYTSSGAGVSSALTNTITGTTVVIDPTLVILQVNGAGGTATGGQIPAVCQFHFWRASGPDGYSGVDAFHSVTHSTQGEYLVYGGHFDTADATGGPYKEIQFTNTSGTTLENHSCNISGVTSGNTSDLQQIFGYGSQAVIAFPTDNNNSAPLMATFDFANVDTTAACSNLTQSIQSGSGSGQDAVKLSYLGKGGSPPNNCSGLTSSTTCNVSMDSMVVGSAGAGTQMFIANNGGVSATSTIPIGTSSVWTSIAHDGANGWTGNTQFLPDELRAFRPGEKGIPHMVTWNNYLFVARNRVGGVAELWRYRSGDPNGGWRLVMDSSKTTSGAVDGNGNTLPMDPTNTAISLVAVNGQYLYVGFDNATKGAELWVTKPGVTSSSVDDCTVSGQCNTSFELAKNRTLNRLSTFGLGLSTDPDLVYNKFIFSHAVQPYTDGKSYLYLTVGCNTDFHDDGACDRNRTASVVDFAIRLFRQVDAQ